MRIAIKRVLAGIVVCISKSHFCAFASSAKMSLSAQDLPVLSTISDVSLVPVKNGAVSGDSFKAAELWKDMHPDDALIIHIVRRPG